MWFGDAYLWRKGLDEGKRFDELDPEQQAEFIADADEAGFNFQDPNATFIDPDTRKDYTDQLREALEMIRSGNGAP